jgi:hypothetical protein
MFKNGITIITIMVIILLASGCTNYRQPTDNVSNMPTVLESGKNSATINGNTVNYADFYKPIINAYIALEQSGYTSYDEKILSKDVCLIPGGNGSYFIGYDNKPVLVFAFCNLGGDDTPELLIGADLGIADGAATGSNVFVTGIYGLRDDKPVSLIQVGDWSQLNFFVDNDSNPVIKKISGTHNDYAEEYFYKIDKNETLITLDKLYTYGKINDYSKPDDISYSHTKDINGKEVSITEQEYLTIMQKYGSVGYLDNTGDFKANEIVINSWELLSTYKNKGKT